MDYRLGIIAYASHTGLGYQTREYCAHLKPDKILAVDLSRFNNMPVYRDWYPESITQWVNGIPNETQIEEFLNSVDVVFYAETPLNYHLHKRAKELGVKVVQAYNYEFLDYFKHPDYEGPTVLAAPSVWNMKYVEKLNKAPVEYWPVPVDRDVFKPRKREVLKHIIHIIGRPAVHDRNGTLSFLEAISRIGPEYKYTVYLQPPKDSRGVEYFRPVQEKLDRVKNGLNINIVTDVPKRTDLYKDGDLLVLPRRYGGLCLPMQEALSCGIPVVMTNISPNYARLPQEWLARAKPRSTFRGHTEIPVYEAITDHLVEVINRFADPKFISNASDKAISIGDSSSWTKLVNDYKKWFYRLLSQ